MSTEHPLRDVGAPVDTTPDAPVDETAETTADDEMFDDDGVLYDDEVTPEHGILGFTLRELLIVGVWLVMFIVSFFPLGWSSTIWSQGIAWILPVGVPTIAVFLVVLRRFSPDGIRRVGSLGIDQFASVASSVAAVWWAQQLWEYLAVEMATGLGTVVWVPWVQFVLSLALVALTVFAPLIPRLAEDFHGRLVTLAHRNANPVRPVIARPRTERPETTTVISDVTDAAAEGPAADDAPVAQPAPAVVSVPALDVELSGEQATDEVARIDLAAQVPLAAHASGGGTGTAETTADEEYVPTYSRRSRGEDIVSDTASIEELIAPATAPVIDEGTADDGAADTGVLDAEPVDDESADDESADRASVHDVRTRAHQTITETTQPFWILAPTDRDVHDERGDVIFRIGPNAWALVIEDRGGAYVVRHDDGRIGYLHDIADITKG